MNLENKLYAKLVELLQESDRKTLQDVCHHLLDRLWVNPKEREAIIDKIAFSSLRFIAGTKRGRPSKDEEPAVSEPKPEPVKAKPKPEPKKKKNPEPAQSPQRTEAEEDEDILRKIAEEVKDIEDAEVPSKPTSDIETMMK